MDEYKDFSDYLSIEREFFDELFNYFTNAMCIAHQNGIYSFTPKNNENFNVFVNSLISTGIKIIKDGAIPMYFATIIDSMVMHLIMDNKIISESKIVELMLTKQLLFLLKDMKINEFLLLANCFCSGNNMQKVTEKIEKTFNINF